MTAAANEKRDTGNEEDRSEESDTKACDVCCGEDRSEETEALNSNAKSRALWESTHFEPPELTGGTF